VRDKLGPGNVSTSGVLLVFVFCLEIQAVISLQPVELASFNDGRVN